MYEMSISWPSLQILFALYTDKAKKKKKKKEESKIKIQGKKMTVLAYLQQI